MKNLGKLALTGLCLILMGILTNGCVKKKELVVPSGFHNTVDLFQNSTKGNEKLYTGFEHEKTKIDSFKPTDYFGETFKYFQLGKISFMKGIATNSPEMIDSAKNCYNRMLNSLDNLPGTQTKIFGPEKIFECKSDLITYGPLELYHGLLHLTKKTLYVDSVKNYLDLAKSANNIKTPAQVLLSQNFISSHLNDFNKDYLGSINDLKKGLKNLQDIQMNPLTKKQNEMFYLKKISKLYENLEQQDSSNVYSKKANKIAKNHGWAYLLN